MSDWRLTENGWRHAPWWKVAINTVLRALQRNPRKWVIYTRCDNRFTPPRVLGYGFGKVLHR